MAGRVETAEGVPGPAQRMFEADRASLGLGMELLAAADGAATLRMTVTGTMVNGHGIAHGGYLSLLADSAFACACDTHGPVAVAVAAGADIDFLEPVRLGDTLTATIASHTRFGRSGVHDVTVRRGDEVVAEFRGRSRELRQAPAGTAPAPTGVAPDPVGTAPAPASAGQLGEAP